MKAENLPDVLYRKDDGAEFRLCPDGVYRMDGWVTFLGWSYDQLARTHAFSRTKPEISESREEHTDGHGDGDFDH